MLHEPIQRPSKTAAAVASGLVAAAGPAVGAVVVPIRCALMYFAAWRVRTLTSCRSSSAPLSLLVGALAHRPCVSRFVPSLSGVRGTWVGPGPRGRGEVRTITAVWSLCGSAVARGEGWRFLSRVPRSKGNVCGAGKLL